MALIRNVDYRAVSATTYQLTGKVWRNMGHKVPPDDSFRGTCRFPHVMNYVLRQRKHGTRSQP